MTPALRESGPEKPAAGWRLRMPPTRPLEPAADRGAATVLVLGLVAVLLAMTVGVMLLAGAVVASHRARLAADLAALAGAARLGDGEAVDRACATADRVAAMNDALLVSCAADGLALEVTVAVTAPVWPEPARARAKAGPAAAAPLPAARQSSGPGSSDDP